MLVFSHHAVYGTVAQLTKFGTDHFLGWNEEPENQDKIAARSKPDEDTIKTKDRDPVLKTLVLRALRVVVGVVQATPSLALGVLRANVTGRTPSASEGVAITKRTQSEAANYHNQSPCL